MTTPTISESAGNGEQPALPGVGRGAIAELLSAGTSSAASRRLRCTADGQPVQPQGRLAHAHRHALAVLAAGADAGVELHVVADHADTRVRHSGPEPIRVAPLIGAPSLPFSMR